MVGNRKDMDSSKNVSLSLKGGNFICDFSRMIASSFLAEGMSCNQQGGKILPVHCTSTERTTSLRPE